MTRIERAATSSANTTTTAITITATIAASSMHHERGRAPYLDNLDALAGLDHLVVVEAARRPHLAAVDPHAADALVVGDALEHHRRPAHERGRARADRRRQAPVAARDGTQRE